MVNMAVFSPTQPRRAKTSSSAGKGAANEEARRTFRYIEPLSAARTLLEDFFSILLEHEEKVEIIDVRAGGTGDDELVELLQGGFRVVALQRAFEIPREVLRARHCMTIDNGSGCVSRTVGAIGTDRHHPHVGQPGDFQSAGGGKFLRPPARSLSCNGYGGFSTGNHTTGSLQRLAREHDILCQQAKSLPLFTGLTGYGLTTHKGS